MTLHLCFIISFTVISCNPLLPDQSVISLFDKSRKRGTHPTPTPIDDSGVVDVIEEWDFITPPPVRTPNAMHEVEEKVIATMKGDSTAYSSRKEDLFVQGVAERLEESHSMTEDSDSLGEVNFISKKRAENNVTRYDSSSPSNTASTLSPETTRPISFTGSDNFQKNESFSAGAVFESHVTTLLELLNALATFLAPTLPSAFESACCFPSSVNSTDRSAKIEQDEGGAEVVDIVEKVPDKVFSRRIEIEFGGNVDVAKEANERADDPADIEDDAVAANERSDGKVKMNSKLDPQVIPRSEFAKNGIEEQEISVTPGCDAGTLKGNLEQRKSSNCEPVDKEKSWKSQDQEAEEKYGEDGGAKRKPPVLGHLDRTLWEKLIAGLKCSQRDCGEALRPTESVQRYLMQPSISRARKHSNGGH